MTVANAAPRRATAVGLVLAWAFGAAMWTGLAQDLISGVRRVALHEFIWVSREFVWMTPAGYAAIFLALAIPVSVTGALTGVRWSARIAGFVFGALGVFAVLLLFTGLHPLASVVAALGTGTRVAAWAARGDVTTVVRRSRRFLRGGLVLAAAFALGGALNAATRLVVERRAVASLPAAPAGAPNVLLVILDTVRAASMSFMGYERETTPNLARRAAQGATFDHAYAVAPWTLPSHAGMFTARYPSTLSTDWQAPLDGREPTLAESMRARGFVTAGFAANHFYTSWESGLTRGFDHYEDYIASAKQVLLSTSLLQTNFFWAVVHDLSPGNVFRQLGHLDLRTQTMWTSDRKLAARAGADFLSWQAREGSSGRPFFAFINLYDAHLPYDPPWPWRTKFTSPDGSLDRYDGAVAYMDSAVGAVLDSLERRGVLDHTIVVVGSDHGEAFGEHHLYGHGNSLYRSELHVPLIIRYPAKVPHGVRVDRVASLRDVAATVLELAGVRDGSPLTGASLARTWDGAGEGASVSPAVSEVSAGINTAPTDPVSRGAMRSLIDAEGHYIRNGDAVEELYRYRDDPGELRDLARGDSARSTVIRMREAANAATARGGTPTVVRR